MGGYKWGSKKCRIKGLASLGKLPKASKGHEANRVNTLARTFIVIESISISGLGLPSVPFVAALCCPVTSLSCNPCTLKSTRGAHAAARSTDASRLLDQCI